MLRAIASQVPGLNVDGGKEKEISAELERRSGRRAQGLLAPMAVFERRVDNITTALPAGGPGANLIATDFLGSQFIDILREALAIQRLGARTLSNLVGLVDIPKLKQSASAEWVAEDAAITASDMQFDKLSLTPKHIGSIIQMSRNMLLQSTPSLETLARNDMAQIIARAIDRVAIAGGGSNEPSGILNSDASDLSAIAPAPLSWADVIALIGAVAGYNALGGSLGFLTNFAVTSKLATTLKSSADTASSYILASPGSNQLAGYPLVATGLCPGNLGTPPAALSAIIFGDFSQVLVSWWSAFDVLVNPYESTAYSKGNVLVRAMATCDVGIRQEKAFAFMTSVQTTTGGD